MWEILGVICLVIAGCAVTILTYFSVTAYLPGFIMWLQAT